jgi:hypothetical protein
MISIVEVIECKLAANHFIKRHTFYPEPLWLDTRVLQRPVCSTGTKCPPSQIRKSSPVCERVRASWRRKLSASNVGAHASSSRKVTAVSLLTRSLAHFSPFTRCQSTFIANGIRRDKTKMERTVHHLFFFVTSMRKSFERLKKPDD